MRIALRVISLSLVRFRTRMEANYSPTGPGCFLLPSLCAYGLAKQAKQLAVYLISSTSSLLTVVAD